ncbi:MAG: UvrB/UvrC motif-containing protein [Endomicrobium sp.]|nr:UvrB/UvrC motif-containing protein [Endomicrobium sp.]
MSLNTAAENLDFESAAVLRDRMIELKNMKSEKSMLSKKKSKKKVV